MRFLHTADWHLGRLFHGVHLTDDQSHVLEQLLDLVAESNLDAVVIAGDVYDRAVPPAEAVDLLDDVITRLVMDIGVPTIVIAGNHDSAQRLRFGARVLRDKGLFMVGELPDASPITIGDVDFLPLPFAVPESVRTWLEDSVANTHEAGMKAMLERISSHRSGRPEVVIGHAFVVGGRESESERALAIGRETTIPAEVFDAFNFTALGHLHEPQAMLGGRVSYSGSLLKYSFGEADHEKSVSIVELDDAGRAQVERIALSPRRDVRVLEGRLDEVLTLEDPSPHDYLMVRLLDREPLLNPMAKLRDRFPNVLHVDRPMFGPSGKEHRDRLDHRKMTALDLFASFYRQTTGDTLTDAQRGAVGQVVDEVEHEGTQ